MPRAPALSTDGAAKLLQKAGAEGEGYGDVLGLRLVGDEPYALVFESDGATLRVQKVASVTPPQYTVLGWSVSDIEATMERLRAGGVRFETFGMPGQDKSGVWTAGDGTRVAWFKDPDGNLLSLTQL